MYRLLIVDNEKLIVDNLVDLFVKTDRYELEVYGAYTAASALELMARTKVDIVISDIRMPGMSGLELQQEINRQWPDCKIIFLSGYDDFEYVQQALRHNSVDYLLKTEGEQKVIETVGESIRQLEEAWGKDRLLEQAKRHMQATRPLLQKEFLWSVLQGEERELTPWQRRFAELQLPLGAEGRVLLAIGRVDDWRDDVSPADRELLLYAVRNIADEYWNAGATTVSLAFDKNKAVWLIQPRAEGRQGEGRPQAGKPPQPDWPRLVRFAHGTAEAIQRSCKQLLGLKLSLAVAGEPQAWTDAAGQFDSLKLLLSFGAGLGQESILIDRHREEQLPVGGYDHDVRTELKRLHALADYLDNGQRQPFFADFASLASLANADRPSAGSLRMEIALTLASTFLAYINRWGLQGAVSARFDLNAILRFDPSRSWNETMSRFAELAEWLFELKWKGWESHENDIVKRVQWYVEQNVAGDLSLIRIGEVVGHNPHYLSRLYKQITDENLSDYIASVRMRKAKELLARPNLRIGDISNLVGFASEHSFYRFFKKLEGSTPQEYREQAAKK